MKTAFFIPPLSIAEYVSGILVVEDFNSLHEFVIPLFANGCPTLVFQTAPAIKAGQTTGHLSLYGQTIQPGELKFKDPFVFIAYFFYPHALNPLFGINPREITGSDLDLMLLKQARDISLEAQLLNTTPLAKRLELIDMYILKLAGQKTKIDEKIVFATSRLRKSNGLYTLTELQKELHTTERSFQRLFESQIGIAPNLYRRICQFQFAFQQVNQKKVLKLTDIAYDSGFADQSHFIRVFKEFTGLTPNEYLAKRAPYNPEF
ncbi:helix-turn-helix domain-containing protein [Niabella sp. CC-SYL272]|uniref:helix-turn-helix domain-containing protein n=1 Tax=Niabella agricola TaxID=2891571 RepID=UPI001F337FF0|nr:helix-turn-helix domain-containing protein [Niabella agricola]MCF3110529.1 helix-turn-helix domain-containing protein [Niabella agricola]